MEETMNVASVNVLIREKSCITAAIYCPPHCKIIKEDYTDLFCKLSFCFIIGGHFFAKHIFWCSRLITPKGKELYSATIEKKCEVHSTEKSTYWHADSNKIPDLTDFFTVRGVSSSCIYVVEDNSLTSHETPIIPTLSWTVIEKPSAQGLTSKKTNCDAFREKLANKIQF